MGITVPVIGSTPWGTTLNNNLGDLAQSGFNPPDLGYKAWTFDPEHAGSNGTALTSGTVRWVRLPRFTRAESITGLGFVLGAAAVGPAAGQCFVALYTLAGVRVAVSGDVGASMVATGLIKFPFTGVYAAAAGDYVATLLFNGGTGPSLGGSYAGGANSVVNGDLTLFSLRVANGPTLQTSMPASILSASLSGVGAGTFAGAY
jgi:hypothetical protein